MYRPNGPFTGETTIISSPIPYYPTGNNHYSENYVNIGIGGGGGSCGGGGFGGYSNNTNIHESTGYASTEIRGDDFGGGGVGGYDYGGGGYDHGGGYDSGVSSGGFDSGSNTGGFSSGFADTENR